MTHKQSQWYNRYIKLVTLLALTHHCPTITSKAQLTSNEHYYTLREVEALLKDSSYNLKKRPASNTIFDGYSAKKAKSMTDFKRSHKE